MLKSYLQGGLLIGLSLSTASLFCCPIRGQTEQSVAAD